MTALGCNGSDEGSDDAAGGGGLLDAAQLIEIANENIRLDMELSAAEDRIIAECLEAQGFTVHDMVYLGQNEPYEVDTVVYSYPADPFLPTVDDAAQYGFGWWADTEEMWESQETQDYYEATSDLGPETPEFDNSAFDALSEAERRAWRVAYQGEEAVEALEYDPEAGGEDAGGGEDGALDFGGGGESGPEPGGCQLEMIEQLYDAPYQVEIEGTDQVDWEWRPRAPEIDLEAAGAEYAARIADANGGFLDCIDERGYPGWEFNDEGTLAMIDYSSLLYTGETYDEGVPDGEDRAEDTNPPVPDLPEDVPDDFDGKRAYETDMAVAFAECGDETGYRDTATSTYDQVVAELYTAIETDIYAWQGEIKDYTAKAQELISG
ncbi:hypothetical protein B0I28_111113 [Glycomyces artemisiae]|uniref:Uncharacterized protein n=2 Tax=Glycomyces artemisiae TaxID=1076443 RepID=A0A2T0UDW9_9ACTN|nr:hypothetical protein B0I28_111113 [Glycomyces artemisiae]